MCRIIFVCFFSSPIARFSSATFCVNRSPSSCSFASFDAELEDIFAFACRVSSASSAFSASLSLRSFSTAACCRRMMFCDSSVYALRFCSMLRYSRCSCAKSAWTSFVRDMVERTSGP